jgi:hypothetical protein
MDRQYEVVVIVTITDVRPEDPNHEVENVARAIEEARDQLMRWQRSDSHGVDLVVQELV